MWPYTNFSESASWNLIELKIRKWTKVPQDKNYRLIINLDDECLTVRTSITGTHVVNDFNIF